MHIQNQINSFKCLIGNPLRFIALRWSYIFLFFFNFV